MRDNLARDYTTGIFEVDEDFSNPYKLEEFMKKMNMACKLVFVQLDATCLKADKMLEAMNEKIKSIDQQGIVDGNKTSSKEDCEGE